MRWNNKTIYISSVVIWYFCIIYFSLGIIYPLIKITPRMFNEQLLTTILYFLRHLFITLPILYCFFQFKHIVLSLSKNNFFSFGTANRFRNIGYGIMFLNCKIIIDIIHLSNMPISSSSGSSYKITYVNYIKQYPIDFLITIRSPLVTLFSTFILGFIFVLIAKTMNQATIMKNEIDQTV